MSMISSWTRSAKIVFGVGLVSSIIAVACVGVGTSFYIQEYMKLAYKKDICQIKAATYETLSDCFPGMSRNSLKHQRICYIPVWHVQFGFNGIHKSTIKGMGFNNFDHMLAQREQYQVESSYPCWYKAEKPSVVIWYQPNPFIGFVLIIIGVVILPISILMCFVGYRIRSPTDL